MAEEEADEAKSIDRRLAFISQLVQKSFRVKAEKWEKFLSSDERNAKIIAEFFAAGSTVPNLFFAISTSGIISLSTNVIGNTKGLVKVVYLRNCNPTSAILPDSDTKELQKQIYYAELPVNILSFCIVALKEISVPVLENDRNRLDWSQLIREDISQQLGRISRDASILEAKTQGRTLLPFPQRPPGLSEQVKPEFWTIDWKDIADTTYGRQLVYAVETVVIEWAHQVETLLSQDSAQPLLRGEHSTPRTEVAFWRQMFTSVEFVYDQMMQEKARRMGQLLESANSAYSRAFKKVFVDVVKAFREAQDISTHLQPLGQYIEDFENVEFDESEKLIPPIWHLVCLVWSHSQYYRLPARVILLIREMCNLVIQQAQQFLPADEVFKGEAEEVLPKVCTCLRVLDTFWQQYLQHRDRLPQYFEKSGSQPVLLWRFSHSMAFSRFDAFRARLEQIRLVLAACLEFAKLEKVEFGGWKGNLLSDRLRTVAEDFQQAYQRLSEQKYNCMDPADEGFQADYDFLMGTVMELYRRLASIYSIAFHDCSGLEAVFKLAAVYSTLKTQPFIREAIDESYAEILTKIDAELEVCKAIYDKQLEHRAEHGRYRVHCNQPQVAGALKWSAELRRRANRPIEELRFINKRSLDTEQGHLVLKKKDELLDYLDKFDRSVIEEWRSRIDSECQVNLGQFLLLRQLESNYLEVNFDPKLVAALSEVKYIRLLNSGDGSSPSTAAADSTAALASTTASIEIPAGAEALYAQRETLRVYYANLYNTVRWYNYLHDSLLHYERALMADKMQSIENLVEQGLTSVTWESPDALAYIEQLRDLVHSTYRVIVQAHANTDRLQAAVRGLAARPVFERTPEKYETLLKCDDREETTAARYRQVEEVGREVHALVQENQQLFQCEADSDIWRIYLETLDHMVLDGLTEVVTASLNYLLKHTESRPDQQPLFEIKMELDTEHAQIEFRKSLNRSSPDSFYDFIDTLLGDIFRQGRFIARVAGHFAEQSPDYRNYQTDLENHQMLNDLRTTLVDRHVAPATAQALKYRESFRKHASLWTDDRQEFLRQFLLYGHTLIHEEVEQGGIEESPPTLAQFREQIDHFEEVYNELSETQPHVIFDGWLRVDARPFKQALLNTVRKWSQLLKEHLVNHVINSLSELDSFIQETKEILASEPQPGDYHQLVAVMSRLGAQKERQAQTDAMFEPLQQTIELLKEYGQEMPPEVHDQLEVLPESWSNCKKMAAQMRTGLLPLQNQQVSRISSEASEFDHSQRALQEAFRCCTAFQRTCLDPYGEIDEWNSRLVESEVKAAELVESGRLFEVNIPDFKLIRLCRKELQLLKSLWDLLYTIRFNIEAWQETPWMQVDVDMMDLECKNFAKLLRQLDSAARSWDAYAGGETDVKNMLTSLRAVTELRNPAIRDRHWAALMSATGVRFTMSESTTLHQLLQLELHRFEEDVRNIVDKAVKEMAMEKTLKEIEANWTVMELEHERHPRTGITIVKASDEVIETLEDNQAQLQNMLTSKHVAYFQEEVRDWVHRLATADQVLAIYLEVQRTWINLESIFIGSEDIREQLPESSQRFEAIDKDFKEIVVQVERYTNVIASTNQPNLYNRLEKVQQDLSVCEKALMDYMETKRLAFPRFYFVSHNDLLDILSHGNEPVLVMKHLRKLFDSMAKLRFIEDGDGRPTKTANAMWSKDGEFVKLCSQPTLDGQVEVWLSILLKEMRDTMRQTLSDAVANFEEKPRDQWIFDYPAQVALSGSQIGWTVETNLAFSRLEEGFENALKEFNKKQIANLNALISLLIGELSAQDRQKIMTICTIDVHNRDIVGKLIAQKVENSQAFTWLSQLRHRWNEQQGDCFANICDAEFRYYHEYLGNTPRLVITPLTDRCYITLTQSLHLYMSGAPAGPAGTGKTETTKDLGRALGMMVYVFNCSEQMDYRSIGNIYKGLAQSGAWGCFDEFNRIAVEVLSVVAVQVKCIQDALKALAASQPEHQLLEEGGRFKFLGEEINLSTSVGIFITMNPGYAGRTELPENLKALFRPCAMVVPDFDLICEIMLVAEGFLEARLLAKKFITLYELCKELLSKQDHYDWGLRAIKSVLVVAGSLKRSDPTRPENQVLMRALRDFNIPKIVTDDMPVFMGLIRDLFPALDVPRKRDLDFEKQVRQAALDLRLQPEENFILKVVQLQELFAVRHSVFINGFAGTGKSEVWKTLHRTYQNQKLKPMALDLNPKAVTNDELFGIINPATREWRDGIFSVVMRDLANVTHDGPKWIVLDGDIDPMWIESLNTVMDDNKVLTLASNERIPLTPSMRLLFEISHLRTATPATVSRAGILYINPGDLGWLPFVTSWINARGGQTEQANLTVLFDKYVPPCLEVLKSKFKKVTPIPEISHVQMLCCLLESIMTPENGITADATKDAMEPLFCFACIWAFGGCTFQDQLVDHRVEFSKWFLHEFKMPKVAKDYGVFDVYLDFETKRFEPWSKRVPKFELDPEIPLQSTLVHTAETARVKYLLDLLLAKRYPVMLVGNAGTGKSVLMQEKLLELVETSDNYMVANVPFNFYTTSEMLQRVLERPLEKKSGKNFGPPGTRRLIYFVDDMNMPEVDKYFTVQPHALIRQHLDYGHWYDRQKISLKEVHNTQYVACMNPTAGSFSINPRLQRHFAVLAMSLPGHDAMETIYTSILSQHLGDTFPAEVRRLQTVKDIVHATLGLHQRMLQNFLPTAVKFHYLFNLRDLSAVFQGMLFAEPDCLQNRMDLIRLWMHECERVYCDKLVDSEDIAKYQSISKDVAKKMLSDYLTGAEEAAFRRPLLFCHFAKHMGDEKYQAVESLQSIDHVLTEALDSYNEINAAMNLVLFEDAISHILRISRILESPRGNALLVGVGGSGKQSLSRLAAFLTSLEVFQISLRKGYGIADLRADIAQMYVRSGQKGIRTMFLLTDGQISDEKFLVLVNDMLASGEVPDLFTDDELESICNAVKGEVRGMSLPDTKENCWRYFIDQVRLKLKIVLCFSPVGSTLRIRGRKFPALVNNTTIDWFHEWPREALVSVSKRFLAEVSQLSPEIVQSTAEFMAYAHQSVNEASEQYRLNEKRYNYTTPKSFLEQIQLYRNLLNKKDSELETAIARLDNGLKKLESTAEQVDDLKAKLAEQEVEVAAREQTANEILARVDQDAARVAEEKAVADSEEEKVSKKQAEVQIKTDDCQKDLSRALPALEAAEAALNTLNRDNLTEMKSFTSPPPIVVSIASAVLVLMAKTGKIPRDRSWKAAKVMMGRVDQFLDSLITYDKDNIHENCLKAVKEYTNKPGFEPEQVKSKSIAAAGLCAWVINIIKYYQVYCEVKPKRDALEAASKELQHLTNNLNNIKQKVGKLQASLDALNEELKSAKEEKRKVQEEAETTARTIELADRLVHGLASENERWGREVQRLTGTKETLAGDVLVTAAYVSYVGYFTKNYRTELLSKRWLPFLASLKTPICISDDLDPIKLLVDDAQVATWNNEGLPSDQMSIENAAVLTTCERWPLMVDPQLQGVEWIKRRYGSQLRAVRIGQKKYLDAIEAAISAGEVVLIENIGEQIDPVLDPLLGRNTIKRGRAIRIGDKEIDYHQDFKLILHTKLANPHFKPEIQAQTTLINFTVTRGGLEDQLLASVVRKEKPDLEELKSELTRNQNEFKITLKHLEDALLAKLSAAQQNFLGDAELVENLENNKRTALEIESKVKISKATEIDINRAREKFRPCAARASMLFFVMNDLWMINPMYQFSLKAFETVFNNAIDHAEETEDEEERVRILLESITFLVTTYTTRGLFERDKLIFTTQMTLQVMLLGEEIDPLELDFLLRFPIVPGLSSPVDFITGVGWGGVKALAMQESGEFKNLDNDIIGSAKRWKAFVTSECPEREKLPQEWKNKSALQKLCIMRALRPDRMTYAMMDFISTRMGSRYVEGRPIDFPKSFEESSSSTPIFFILSPGVDPLKEVESLGRKKQYTEINGRFHNISLGQGQEVVAERALELASRQGHWVVLQNVHLVKNWLPTLDKILEAYASDPEVHAEFRVFISAEPSPTPESHIIPQGILETSIKITNEPPTGMHANLHKAFALFDQDTLDRCSKQVEFNAILFSLCYFHAVISERRKFGSIGWNRSYPFNNGDLTISVDVLYNYLEANSSVPWEDLRYLFGEIMYGGHITDDWDRRLCRSYLETYMQPALVEGEMELAPGFQVAPVSDYPGYLAYIDENLPAETPYLYGLHPNAEVEFLTKTAANLFRTVFEMQPRDAGGAGAGAGSRDEKIRSVLEDLVERMPEPFLMSELLGKIAPEDRTPFTVVALQECERMNILLSEMRTSLRSLELGLKGELTITAEMEALGGALFLDQVPDTWAAKAYPSLQPLGVWFGDLQQRVRELDIWASDFQLPPSVWLGGLFNPQSFLTAVMQQMARKNEWPLDKMAIQVDVTKRSREDVGGAPREGAYVHGLFMEGAQWDSAQGVREAALMQIAPELPVLFIRAVPTDRLDLRGTYACPVYKTKARGPTFVWTFNLKTKDQPSRWILAGVALLLQV